MVLVSSLNGRIIWLSRNKTQNYDLSGMFALGRLGQVNGKGMNRKL